jgi:hypothetical protein
MAEITQWVCRVEKDKILKNPAVCKLRSRNKNVIECFGCEGPERQEVNLTPNQKQDIENKNPVCIKCSAPISGIGKTGMCRECAQIARFKKHPPANKKEDQVSGDDDMIFFEGYWFIVYKSIKGDEIIIEPTEYKTKSKAKEMLTRRPIDFDIECLLSTLSGKYWDVKYKDHNNKYQVVPTKANSITEALAFFNETLRLVKETRKEIRKNKKNKKTEKQPDQIREPAKKVEKQDHIVQSDKKVDEPDQIVQEDKTIWHNYTFIRTGTNSIKVFRDGIEVPGKEKSAKLQEKLVSNINLSNQDYYESAQEFERENMIKEKDVNSQVAVDFSKHHALLVKLNDMARENFRTPEGQILFLISDKFFPTKLKTKKRDEDVKKTTNIP